MTIIKLAKSLKNYPYRFLSDGIVEVISIHAKKVLTRSDTRILPTLLKLLECFCDLKSVRISVEDIPTLKFKGIVDGFLVALQGQEFFGASHIYRNQFTRCCFAIVKSIYSEFTNICINQQPQIYLTEIKEDYKNQLNNVNEDERHYWCGWQVENRTRRKSYLLIPLVWNSHGKEFATKIYEGYKTQAEKRRAIESTLVNAMLLFLSENKERWPKEAFQNPIELKNFFKHFFHDHFIDAHTRGIDINTRLRSWNKFITITEQALIEPGTWAPPFGDGLPRSMARDENGSKTRIKKRIDGTEVKEKLLTEIPLQIKDEQAIEILFHTISRDIERLTFWAETQVKELMERYFNRRKLAKKESDFYNKRKAGKRYCSYREEDVVIGICKFFELDGFQTDTKYIKKYLSSRHGILNKRAANILALPIAGSLYSFQVLLIAEHTEITPEFLKEFQLFDKRGNLSGFIKTDSGYQLIGYKNRKGKKLAEQRIKLTLKTTKLIKNIIELTTPLRDYLKRNNDPNWTYLFLTCGVGFNYPNPPSLINWNDGLIKSEQGQRFLSSLKKATNISEEEARLFIKQASLTSLRASCAVQVYIETQSVQKMSEALGHTNYNPNLLSHYLPAPISDFFQARWVRIFQKAIICEAMKESPLFLDATNFSSMKILHKFLKNHALKEIPEHLRNPENLAMSDSLTQDNGNNAEIYISIDKGILVTLISLERAVEAATNPNAVSGLAHYWAKLTKFICTEIKNGENYSLLKCLKDAEIYADVKRMEKLIYEAP